MTKYIHDGKEIEVPEGQSPPEGAEKVKESLSDQDTSNFSNEQKDDYIDKLKDENARRRINNRKLTDSLESQKKELETVTSTLDELKKKVSDYETKDREAELKDASEIEKLKQTVKDLEKSISEKDSALKASNQKQIETERKVLKQERELLVDRLCAKMNFSFSSDFERAGMITTLSDLDNDGQFVKNDEEVILEVTKFIKEKGTPPDTPPSGPGSRKSELPIVEEIKTLIAKKDLTVEDQVRLNELTNIVEKGG